MDKSSLTEVAARLAAGGQIDRALSEYRRALQLEPTNGQLHANVAELLQRKGDNAAAADALMDAARLFAEQQHTLKGIALYKQALRLAARVEVNQHLAELYEKLGIVGDAVREWRSVLASAQQAGERARVETALERLVILAPGDAEARFSLARLYVSEGKRNEALVLFRKAVEDLRHGTADLVPILEQIVAIDATDITAGRELAQLLSARGDHAQALARLEACRAAAPDDAETLRLVAVMHERLGQMTKAVAAYQMLARAQIAGGHSGEARATYAHVLELVPDDAQTQAALLALVATEAKPEAAPALEARYAEELAEVDFLSQQGLFDDARRALQDLLRAVPAFGAAKMRLAALPIAGPPERVVIPVARAAAIGRELETSLAKEIGEFKRQIDAQIAPDDGQSHYDLGIAYKDLGLLDEAIAQLRQAALDPRLRVECLTLIGVCLEDRQQFDDAFSEWQAALFTAGCSTEATKALRYHLGHGLEQVERFTDALTQYNAIQQLEANYRDVRGCLERVRGRIQTHANAIRTAGPPAVPFVQPQAPAVSPALAAAARAAEPENPDPTPTKPRKIGFI